MSAATAEGDVPPPPESTQDASQMASPAEDKSSQSPATAVSPATPVAEPPEPTPELSTSASSMTVDSASPAPSSTTLKAPSRASSKGSATPPPQAQPKKGKKATPNPPQFIGHLPVAREEALRTFRQIPENWYQYAKLGKSREAMEGSTCDCEYEEGDNIDHACGPRSNCINRLTQVECLAEDCHCRQFCQNQRFQRKEYAPIEIVQTEKKGFGLRAERDIQKDAFIYEYVGDVVNSPSFKKRMRDYAKEGIQHFYFMMLQKDEFIDATKSGGIGRFANHSCSPNCYVAKWTVDDRVRMGIFAKRNIKKHEELTFNYNVDRYGHQAQICYCGEPNCVGYIGGKTQTDVAVIDDVYLEALGITDADELMELKGSKKKKGKKIDDPDFMPKMRPIKREEVPKVVQALRQVQSAKVLYKLLTRLKTTEDASALREFMRLRGFSVMRMILDEFAKDLTIIAMALECMTTWPLEKRNKVEDSKIADPVRKYAEVEDEAVKTVAAKLLETWDKLEIAYRIPRLARDPSQKRKSDLAEVITLTYEDNTRTKRVRYDFGDDEEANFKATLLPSLTGPASPPPSPPKARAPSPPPRKASALNHADEMKRLMARAQQLAAEQARQHEERARADKEAAEQAERKQREKEARRAARRAEKAAARAERKARERERKSKQTPEAREAAKERRLLKLVGEVVVRAMSKYAKGLPREVFKKQAKELTHVIADKEKKSASYREGRLEALSEEKVHKMKKFARDYIAKVMRKFQEREKGKRRPGGDDASRAAEASGATPGASTSTAADTPDMEMTVEEAMDMEPDAEAEADADKDESDSDSESDSEDEGGKDGRPDAGGDKGGRMDVDEEPEMDVDGGAQAEPPEGPAGEDVGRALPGDGAPQDVVMKDETGQLASTAASAPSPAAGSLSATQDPRLRSRSAAASA